MSLRKARVVAVYPDRGTCDLVFLDTGARFAQVEISGRSSNNGCSWRTPAVPKPSTEQRAGGIEAGMQNLVAYVGFVGGMPVVMGFSRPADGLTPMEHDRWLDVHDASGSYQTFAPDGSYEIRLPGGGYLRIGNGPHQDLTPLIARGKLPTGGPAAITITLATNAGMLSLSPGGAWTLTGASVVIDAPMTTINGSLTVTGDATIGGRGFLEHGHKAVQTGGDISGPPA